MPPERKDLLVKFIKGFTFLGLILCFAHFYLFDILDKYQKKSTTFTFKRESLKEPTWPAITICSQTPMKTEILTEYGMNRNDFFKDTGKNVTKSLWDVYEEASFQLSQDFKLEVFINQRGWNKMAVGENLISNGSESIMVEEFPTQTRGLCYAVSLANVQMTLTDTVAIKITYQAGYEQHGMIFHFSAENSRHNLIWKTWPYVQKLSYSMAFDSIVTNGKVMDLQETEWQFYNGNENCDNGCGTDQCLTWNDLIDGIDCEMICLPVIWKGLFKNATNVKCDKLKENRCMVQRFLDLRETKVKNCQPPSNEIEYEATFEMPPKKKKKPNVLELRIHYQDSRTVKKEVRIYDEASLIGTLGGFLGLFVGFSFYDTLCCFFELVSRLF